MAELEFNKIFARNLNSYLERNNMTQLDLANKIGVSPAAVSHWCKGLKMPRMDKMKKLADFFGIRPSRLLEDGKPLITDFQERYNITDSNAETIGNNLLNTPIPAGSTKKDLEIDIGEIALSLLTLEKLKDTNQAAEILKRTAVQLLQLSNKLKHLKLDDE